MKQFLLLTLTIVNILGLSQVKAEESARFRITFTGNFTMENFTNEMFPSNPHFSPLVIASHSAAYSMFTEGTLATTGVKNVAETGNPTELLNELSDQEANGHVFEKTRTAGLSETEVATAEITVSREFPLISFITMIAPSPDWIVGKSAFSLLKGEKFIEKISFPLYAIDAGTDDGKYYTSRNAPSSNPFSISLLRDVSGLPIANPFATIVIEKI